jgi:hypothetical protein
MRGNFRIAIRKPRRKNVLGSDGASCDDAERDASMNMKLAQDQREALGMLAASLRGRIESVMQAHGFAIGTLHGLVQEGLATADRGPARFDPRVIVTVLEITDAGRRAIDI